MMPTIPTGEVALVYVGATIRDGAIVHSYAPLGPSDELSERAWIYPAPLTDHPPGSQLAFEHAPGDRRQVIPITGRYVRAWPDAAASSTWVAAHEAVIAGAHAFEQDPPPRLVEILEPLRVAYSQLGEGDRAILIAQVVRSIVGK